MANTGRITQSALEAMTLAPADARITQSALELMIGLGIACGNPPAGTLGSPYSHAFPTGDGDPPLTFAIVAGALPPGLSLDPLTGIVSGIPTNSGAYGFTIQVTDSLFSTAAVACSITVIGVPLIGLRIILRGVKRIQKGQQPEPCGCPELPHVKQAR